MRLFREHVDAIVVLFNEYCTEVTISDDEYDYRDFQEMRDRLGPRLRKFKVTGTQPSVTLSFEIYAIKLSVQYQGGTSSEEEEKRADHLFLRLKDYLAKHQTLIAGLMTPTALIIVPTAAALIIGLALVTSPKNTSPNARPDAIYLDFKHGLMFLFGFSVLALTGVLGTRRTGSYFVYYGNANEMTSFWKRKKDDLIFATLIAIVGAVLGCVGTLVVQHFTNPSGR